MTTHSGRRGAFLLLVLILCTVGSTNPVLAVPPCGTANGPPPDNNVCESENACIGKQPGAPCGDTATFVCEDVTPVGYSGICCRCYGTYPALSPWGIALLVAVLLGAGVVMLRRRARGPQGQARLVRSTPEDLVP